MENEREECSILVEYCRRAYRIEIPMLAPQSWRVSRCLRDAAKSQAASLIVRTLYLIAELR